MNDIIFIIPTIGRDSLKNSINSLLNLKGNYIWKAIIIFDGIKNNLVNYDNNNNLIFLEINKCGNIDIKNNSGLVRNKGIEFILKNKIISKYISFLDDDDTLNPNFIINLYNEEKIFDFECIIFRMMYNNFKIVPHQLTTKIERKNIGISIALKYDLIENNNFRFINHPYEDYIFINKIKYNKKKILISKYVNYFVKTDYIKCMNNIKNYANIYFG